MYPPQMVMPMKEELTAIGFEDLTTPEAVDSAITQDGTLLLVINSVCGCAAGSARPGIRISLQNEKKPNRLATVFAGFDVEATARAREYTLPYPPSSPSIALFKDGKLVHFVERHQIEGRPPEIIAQHLAHVYDTYC